MLKKCIKPSPSHWQNYSKIFVTDWQGQVTIFFLFHFTLIDTTSEQKPFKQHFWFKTKNYYFIYMYNWYFFLTFHTKLGLSYVIWINSECGWFISSKSSAFTFHPCPTHSWSSYHTSLHRKVLHIQGILSVYFPGSWVMHNSWIICLAGWQAGCIWHGLLHGVYSPLIEWTGNFNKIVVHNGLSNHLENWTFHISKLHLVKICQRTWVDLSAFTSDGVNNELAQNICV